ncbi:hypothetical protein ACFYTQ_16595 [Nocardia sp. NPDC004068]|uniref:hypothetical protein n=1 Tax=Nocardia sp. NPDC004068 TaxID=3364303 RepID=UPI0036C35E47
MRIPTAFGGGVPHVVIAHLARELDALIATPFSIESFDGSLLLLEVVDGRARLVASRNLGAALERLDAGCDGVEHGLSEFRDDVAIATRTRWPLDEGAGGRPTCVVESGVLRVAFRGPESEIRLADLDLGNFGPPRIAG